MDYEVISHLTEILTYKPPKVDYIMKTSELVLKVQLMKSISCLMQTNQEFLKFISKNSILEKLLHFLQDVSSTKITQDTKGDVVPLTWLEAKATNIRVKAVEHTYTLEE